MSRHVSYIINHHITSLELLLLNYQIESSAVDGDIRLVNQEAVGAWIIGEPEIFLSSSWRQVCSAFSVQDATVACRQLGHGPGSIPTDPQTDTDFADMEFTPGGFAVERLVAPPAISLNLNCSGTEDNLLDCRIDGQSGGEECRPRPEPLAAVRNARFSAVIACVAEAAAGPGTNPCGRLCVHVNRELIRTFSTWHDA